VLFTRHGIDIDQYAAVKNYLAQFKERFMPRPRDWKGEKWPGRKPGAYQWYEIQDAVDYYAEFMVGLVEQMLELNKKLAEARIPQTAEMLRRQIEATDRQIDQLVYQLYDLTEKEIKIVESAT
jgi:hypothetical protein